MKKTKGKICIVCTSLDSGGAERASATQSVIFDSLGFEVYVVTVNSGVAYQFKGTLFDIGAQKKEKDNSLERFKRLLIFKKFLDKNKFDLIVDNRPRNQAYREFIVTKLIYNIPTIYVIHSFEESLAFTKYSWLNKFLYQNRVMVCVSNAGTEKFKNLYNLKNIHTIYNAFDFNKIEEYSRKEIKHLKIDDYIVFYGRVHDKSKNLKLLLEAYKMSKLKEKNIKMLILGDGPDLNLIQSYSNQLGLNHSVVFKAFTKNPFPFVKNARFLVLTSRSEGFAMVIPEALSLGVPVVSVNCNAGPVEIISNEYNGLLVDNFNPKALAKALDRFVEDKKIYNKCKGNAMLSVKKFSLELITKQWVDLLSKIQE